MLMGMIRNGIETGFVLDRQWYWLRGEMERTKRPALLALAQIFAEANVPYAIIGGVALQFHQTEPRTTLDIDVAVAMYGQLPRPNLRLLASPGLDDSVIPRTGLARRAHQYSLPMIRH